MQERVRTVQKALKKGPGSASAATLWVVRPERDAVDAVRAAAALLKTAEELSRPGNLYIAVGLSPALLASSALAEEAKGAPALPGGEAAEASVLIQVSAQTPVDRLFGLRLVDAALQGVLERRWELTGERILHGMEGLGFHDGTPPAWSEAAALASGGLWLMQQRYQYRSDAFFSLGPKGPHRAERERARALVLGRPPGLVPADADRAPGEPTERAAIEAHVASAPPHPRGLKPHFQTMHEAGFGRLARRSFPFRRDGAEGLMFLATSTSPADFIGALKLFNTEDRLAEFVDAEPARLFFCPHDAESLLPACDRKPLEPVPVPASAEVLEHGPDLVDYTVTVEDLAYMQEVALGRGTLYPPPMYESFREDVRALMSQVHSALSGGDEQVREELERMLEAFHDSSRTLNRMVGRYVTKA